jgi:predicted dehydrogenase
MKKIKFAIIGCGKIGNRHAPKLKAIEDAELVGVCDIIPERAQKLGEEMGCSWYSSMNELLEKTDPDYVNICTPSGLHAEHSIFALNAGKNVLCEKPMALSEKDAVKMVDAAKKNNRSIFVVKQNRYNPPVKLAYKLAKEGKLGKPLKCVVNVYWNRDDAYYDSEPWRGTLNLERSTLFSQVSHFADLMLMFMGRPVEVYGKMDRKNHEHIEIDDTGIIVSQFENGAFGGINYTMCAVGGNFEGSITLFFSKGTIKIGGEYINKIEHFKVEGMDSYELEGEMPEANNYGTYRGSASNHENVFKAIIAKENNGEKDADLIENLVTGEEAIMGIRFMEKAVESSQKDEPIKI